MNMKNQNEVEKENANQTYICVSCTKYTKISVMGGMPCLFLRIFIAGHSTI
ncbi:hypothetical protein PR048_008845, partial [Dryococelus australis]